MGSRFDDQLVKIFEIDVKRSGCTAALFGKSFDSRAGQSVFGIAIKAFFHDFFFSVIMLTFRPHRYLQAPHL